MEKRRIQRVRRNDKVARWVITGGGVLIIVTVIGIFFLIASVAAPLFYAPSLDHRKSIPLPAGVNSADVLAVGTDPYLETGYVLSRGGAFTFFRWRRGEMTDRVALAPPGGGTSGSLRAVERTAGHRFSLLWENGSVSAVMVVFAPRFDEAGKRRIAHEVEQLAALPAERGAPHPERALARFDEEQGLTSVALLPGNRLQLMRIVSKTDLLGESKTEREGYQLAGQLPGPISALAMDRAGRLLYAGTRNGHLLWWELEEAEAPQFMGGVRAFADGRAVTSLATVPGDVVVAVGDEKGGLSTWFPLADESAPQGRTLVRNHALRAHGGAVRRIVPSLQGRTLVSLDAGGRVHFDHITNERELLTLPDHVSFRQIGMTGRLNALAGLDREGRLQLWEVDMPHPEAGWRTYFRKIWYGSYREPAYVWQSSSGDDDFEPKLSLMPLVFGTLKGTFYGMLFAAPLAIFGAMYTSHLMQGGLRRVVKPAIEIMGSVPTVVVGFLAALWLAPILKASLVAMMMMLGLLPLAVVLAVVLWGRASARLPWKLPQGYEFLLLVPVVLLAAAACFALGTGLERALFGGDFTLWLYQNAGLRFDQRNSIVIAFALGFAVVPTIFTIADDALLNVPRNLTAASLALGASRWQTVWRVVLPSASPGISAGLMIGLGRAVGETMIVLMATGNTPIMEWGPFNGMRTLSANIAVEIPEAPFNSTLYRTLFMSAVLLFLFTFVLNATAEMVRHWLRRKYGRY